ILLIKNPLHLQQRIFSTFDHLNIIFQESASFGLAQLPSAHAAPLLLSPDKSSKTGFGCSSSLTFSKACINVSFGCAPESAYFRFKIKNGSPVISNSCASLISVRTASRKADSSCNVVNAFCLSIPTSSAY